MEGRWEGKACLTVGRGGNEGKGKGAFPSLPFFSSLSLTGSEFTDAKGLRTCPHVYYKFFPSLPSGGGREFTNDEASYGLFYFRGISFFRLAFEGVCIKRGSATALSPCRTCVPPSVVICGRSRRLRGTKQSTLILA